MSRPCHNDASDARVNMLVNIARSINELASARLTRPLEAWEIVSGFSLSQRMHGTEIFPTNCSVHCVTTRTKV